MNDDQWLDLWETFGFDNERPEAEYHCGSLTQLKLALRCWESHEGDPMPTIDEAVRDGPLMEVADTNGEHVGYRLRAEVRASE